MPVEFDESPIDGIRLYRATANGIEVRYAETGGDGPLVVFCHGWPESWYSWRHQLQALGERGYRCVAPDMRGYGGTSAPAEVEKYSLFDLVGDVVNLVHVLGRQTATVIGHDWGAAVAWHAALWRPDVVTRVAGLSVPYGPPSATDTFSRLRQLGIHDFYSQYFAEEGAAEAELEPDVLTALKRIYFSASGDSQCAVFTRLARGDLLGNTELPSELPGWLTDQDLEYLASQFRVAGFSGGLNWYRNIAFNSRFNAPWRGQAIAQPSLFAVGELDDVLAFPWARAQIESFPQNLPGLSESAVIPGAGHWLQEERPDEVSELLLRFLEHAG